MIDCPQSLLADMLGRPGEVCLHYDFVGVAGGVVGHTDEHCPRYSALLVVRNDKCRLWQRGGYKGVPQAGEALMLDLHKQHGVVAFGAKRVFVAINADADTPERAWKALAENVAKAVHDQCKAQEESR